MPAKAVTLSNGTLAIRYNPNPAATKAGKSRQCWSGRSLQKELAPFLGKSVDEPLTLADVEAGAAAITAEEARGHFGTLPARAGVPTVPTTDWSFERYGAHWLAHTSPGLGHTQATRRFYALNLGHLNTVIGSVAIGTLDRGHCKAVMAHFATHKGERTRQLLSVNSRKGIARTLSTVLTAAVDDQLLPFHPGTRLTKKMKGAPPAPIDPYTFEESERFLKRCQRVAPAYYAFFFTAFRTGMRVGELVELRWDLDFPASRPHEIHVQRSWNYDQYVADLEAGGVAPEQRGVKGTKSGQEGQGHYAERTAVVAVLEAHRKAQREWAFKQGRPVPALVFTGPRGQRLQPQNLLNRVLPRICEAKLDDLAPVRVITIHTTRHTFVTQMLLKHGRDRLQDISDQIGHKDTRVTEEKYAHWIQRHDEGLTARLNEPAITRVPFGGQ